MASALTPSFVVLLSLLGIPSALAQGAASPAGGAARSVESPDKAGASPGSPLGDTAQARDGGGESSLSPECRVPGSKLYTLAPLKAVKHALKENRPIQVLAIGSSSTAGIGASSPLASYPMRLEGELEKLFPGVEIEVVNRGLSGEVASGAADRMKNTIAEVEPDLVIWQVGTNDALARVDIETFAQSLDETIRWIASHKIDVVLVDPQYTASLAKDDYYARIVKVIQEVAEKDRVPLVQRFEAMRYLSTQRVGGGYLARDQFHLNDLGYRCMAEHVARAVTVALLQPDQALNANASTPGLTASTPAAGQ
jgi:acyl-CoA thioesterase-1